MELLVIIQAIVMGIVEGLTELLPVSSTGHLILAGDLMNFLSHDKRVVFEVFIQMGAMLAIVWHYRATLLSSLVGIHKPGPGRNLYLNVMIAFLPAAAVGFLFSDFIRGVLFSPYVVAAGFIVGGFIIMWVEKCAYKPRIDELDTIDAKVAIKVGLCQCLALIPGTSRSGATIIGGMYIGLSRKAATEFSFFLAIPVIAAASLYALWESRALLSLDDLGIFAVGFVTAFAVTFAVMRALLVFVSRYTYMVFAWYRIAFGLLVLATAYTGVIDWAA